MEKPENNIKNVANYNKVISSLFGFNNLGYTYYMNSVLQALIHYSPFINIFLKEYRSFKNQDISEAFLDLIYLVNKEEYASSAQNLFERSSLYSISPIKFKMAISSKHTQIQKGQQDAIELLRILFEDINKENNCNRYFVP